jgi:hypothetical protein
MLHCRANDHITAEMAVRHEAMNEVALQSWAAIFSAIACRANCFRRQAGHRQPAPASNSRSEGSLSHQQLPGLQSIRFPHLEQRICIMVLQPTSEI